MGVCLGEHSVFRGYLPLLMTRRFNVCTEQAPSPRRLQGVTRRGRTTETSICPMLESVLLLANVRKASCMVLDGR